MLSYIDFKKYLKRLGFSEMEIFYIIGVFFEETEGFTKTLSKIFYNIGGYTSVHIDWDLSTYGWDVDPIK